MYRCVMNLIRHQIYLRSLVGTTPLSHPEFLEAPANVALGFGAHHKEPAAEEIGIYWHP